MSKRTNSGAGNGVAPRSPVEEFCTSTSCFTSSLPALPCLASASPPVRSERAGQRRAKCDTRGRERGEGQERGRVTFRQPFWTSGRKQQKANIISSVHRTANSKQKDLLVSTTGHFSLLRALHMADYITELNGTNIYLRPPFVGCKPLAAELSRTY